MMSAKLFVHYMFLSYLCYFVLTIRKNEYLVTHNTVLSCRQVQDIYSDEEILSFLAKILVTLWYTIMKMRAFKHNAQISSVPSWTNKINTKTAIMKA